MISMLLRTPETAMNFNRFLSMNKIASLAALLIFTGLAPSKLIKIKLAEGITVSIPQELKAMSAEDIAQRYPSVRAPLGSFTNDERLVDFNVNISATQWPDADLIMAQNFFKSGINNLHDRVDWISEGVREIHKREFVYFEFVSRVNGSKRELGEQQAVQRYVYIQYLIEPGRTLVFSFSCPKDLREQWQPIAHAMMKSVRIK